VNAWRCVGITFLCFGTYSSAQTSTAERKSDVYAIYSLMLTNPQTSHGPDDNEVYLIADTTVPGVPSVPCVRPPAEEEQRFAEVIADFNQRKDAHPKLEPAFQITKPFRLLTPEEVDSFVKRDRTKVIALGSKAPDLFRLTDVYFDRNRTLALTAISTWCGGLCGLFQWKVFEKSISGQWQENKWITCTTIASMNRRNPIPSD
jgi:hypothetical protein